MKGTTMKQRCSGFPTACAAASAGGISAFALTVLTASTAFAAGTALDVQSARGTGMAAATTAMIDDASAIFYNPAGIAQGKSFDAQAGVTLISPSFNFTNKRGENTSMPFYVVPPVHAYVAGGVTDDLSLGIGLFTPYGLTIKWPDGWQGRHDITEASLRTFYINPTAAYRIGPVRVGAGFQLARATVQLQKDIRFPGEGNEGHADIGGGTWGMGGNLGVQVEAIKDYLSLGVHYRSAVSLDFDDGKAHFANIPRAFAGTLRDQTVTTSVTQPDSLAFGVATRPVPNVVVDFDAVWFGWSKFRSVNLTYPNDPTGSLNSSQPKNWENTVNFHLGAEATLNASWMLRGGVLIDPTPTPSSTLSPDIPDSTRVNLAAGGTWKHESGVHVDLAYQFIFVTKGESTFAPLPGEYGGFVNILGLTVGYTKPQAKAPSSPSNPSVKQASIAHR